MRRNAARVRAVWWPISFLDRLSRCVPQGRRPLFIYSPVLPLSRAHTLNGMKARSSPRAPGGAPPAPPKPRADEPPSRERDNFWVEAGAKFEPADSTFWRIQPLFPRLVYVARPVEPQKDVRWPILADSRAVIHRAPPPRACDFCLATSERCCCKAFLLNTVIECWCVEICFKFESRAMQLASLLHLVPAETLVFII
jgi:hypothetical protein